MSERFLKIWSWMDAPQEYQDLSRHGGDEDWVLFCPNILIKNNTYLPLMLEEVIWGEEYSYFNGFGHVDRHELSSGDVVVIFAHA